MAYIETVDEADASGELAALYRRAANRDGTIDNVMTVHGLNPESLRTHFEMYVAAMHRASPLTRPEREMVAVAVSRLNGCRYCLRHHLAGLKRLLPEARYGTADALAAGRPADLTGREAALVAFAAKLTSRPPDMDRDDVERLRGAGLDDRAILDLTQVVGYFNYVNRVVQGLGVELESGSFAIGQGPRSAEG